MVVSGWFDWFDCVCPASKALPSLSLSEADLDDEFPPVLGHHREQPVVPGEMLRVGEGRRRGQIATYSMHQRVHVHVHVHVIARTRPRRERRAPGGCSQRPGAGTSPPPPEPPLRSLPPRALPGRPRRVAARRGPRRRCRRTVPCRPPRLFAGCSWRRRALGGLSPTPLRLRLSWT